MATKKQDVGAIDVLEVGQETAVYYLLGRTPLICNRMSAKARQELLLPRGRKNATERATTLKHVPMEEFRASPYTLSDEAAPTYLAALSAWFKRSMATAALDLPGTNKSQIARNIFVQGERIPLYGVPQLLMAVTRSADMARTPDVRTRAIIPSWAVQLSVTFTVPLLRGQMVSRLLAAAGMTIGVGDWRQEKGSGSYGLFEIVPPDHPALVHVMKDGTRAAQLAAMEAPECYDDETSELLSWFDSELDGRRLKGVA
jgi:hypothetical protein